jgi:hypothetical protein
MVSVATCSLAASGASTTLGVGAITSTYQAFTHGQIGMSHTVDPNRLYPGVWDGTPFRKWVYKPCAKRNIR